MTQKQRRHRRTVEWCGFSVLLVIAGFLSAGTTLAGPEDDFESEVAPILIMRCLECHNESTASGDLVLTRDESLRRGGKGGEVIAQGTRTKACSSSE